MFVDLGNPYDAVNRLELWNVLHKYGNAHGLLNSIRRVHWGSKEGLRVAQHSARSLRKSDVLWWLKNDFGEITGVPVRILNIYVFYMQIILCSCLRT